MVTSRVLPWMVMNGKKGSCGWRGYSPSKECGNLKKKIDKWTVVNTVDGRWVFDKLGSMHTSCG